MPQILSRRVVYQVPWFKVAEKRVSGSDKKPFYSLKLADYTTLFALTKKNEVLLVRQYRPAVERTMLELPSGVVDPGESPLAAAKRELVEETGYRAGKVYFLGKLWTDTGRLSNRLWCYYTPDAVKAAGTHRMENGMAVVKLSKKKFDAMLRGGRFGHALNLAVIALAVSKRKYRMEL